MHIINSENFGQLMVPLESYHSLSIEKEQFIYMLIETLGGYARLSSKRTLFEFLFLGRG